MDILLLPLSNNFLLTDLPSSAYMPLVTESSVLPKTVNSFAEYKKNFFLGYKRNKYISVAWNIFLKLHLKVIRLCWDYAMCPELCKVWLGRYRKNKTWSLPWRGSELDFRGIMNTRTAACLGWLGSRGFPREEMPQQEPHLQSRRDLSSGDPTIRGSFLFLWTFPSWNHLRTFALEIPSAQSVLPNITTELILAYCWHPSSNIWTSARPSLSTFPQGFIPAQLRNSIMHHPALFSSCPLLWSEIISIIYLLTRVPFLNPNKIRDSVYLIATASLPPGPSWVLNTYLLTISWKVWEIRWNPFQARTHPAVSVTCGAFPALENGFSPEKVSLRCTETQSSPAWMQTPPRLHGWVNCFWFHAAPGSQTDCNSTAETVRRLIMN